MRITEIISIDSIAINFVVGSKEELLEKMLDLASKSGKISNRDVAFKEIKEREKIMSTGVGKGIALPHAKTNAVTDSVGSLAFLAEPLDYDSLDGEPVTIVFMLLGRENNVGNHLRLLSKISRLMNNDSFRIQLEDCGTTEEVVDLFNKMEEND